MQVQGDDAFGDMVDLYPTSRFARNSPLHEPPPVIESSRLVVCSNGPVTGWPPIAGCRLIGLNGLNKAATVDYLGWEHSMLAVVVLAESIAPVSS